MDAIEKEWLFIEATLLELRDYLFSSALFWPLSVGKTSRQDRATIPKLTPGNLYLSLKKLEAYPFPSEKMQEIEACNIKISNILTDWRSNWKNKAEQEYKVRMRQWGMFLNQTKKEGVPSQASYAYQVRDRVILDLLDAELSIAGEMEHQNMLVLDQTLHKLTKPGTFIWEMDIRPGFPIEKYWYLYVSIQ